MNKDTVPIRLLGNKSTEIDTLQKWRKYATDPEFVQWSQLLTDTHRLISRTNSQGLTYAVEAGRIITEIKRWLKKHPSLMPIKIYFRLCIPDLPQRTASNYEACYRQVKSNSRINYPTIQACLKAYRKANPRHRLKVRSAEQQPKPGDKLAEIISDEKESLSSPMSDWLRSEPVPLVKRHLEEKGYVPMAGTGKEIATGLRAIGKLIKYLDTTTDISVVDADLIEAFSRQLIRQIRHKTLTPVDEINYQ